jgi:hypothetical protein
MKRWTFGLFLMTVLLLPLSADPFEFPYTDAYLTAMGGGGAALQGVSPGLWSNPSSLNGRGVRSFYSRLYGGNIQHLGIGASMAVHDHWVGLTLQTLGTTLHGDYSGNAGEYALGLVVARSLTPRVRLGLRLNTFVAQDPRFQRHTSWGVDVGLLFQPQRFFRIGVWYRNLNQPEIVTPLARAPLARWLETALLMEPYPGTRTLVSLRQSPYAPLAWSVGQEVHLNAYPVSFRVSYRREGSLLDAFSMGAGFTYRTFQLHYSVLMIPELPLTHLFSVDWEIQP